MSEKYETKFEDIKVGDIVVAVWGAKHGVHNPAMYVLRVSRKDKTRLFDQHGAFPADLCQFYVFTGGYMTISGPENIIP